MRVAAPVDEPPVGIRNWSNDAADAKGYTVILSPYSTATGFQCRVVCRMAMTVTY